MKAIYAFILLAPLGCSRDDKPAVTAARIDSASAIIVANPSPHPSVSPTRLQFQEIFTVGARNDSDLERELWDVADALLTPDKHLVVIMGDGREIRVFDSTGHFTNPIGRVGEGPAEFRDASRLGSGVGDTLLVIDQRARRVLAFNARGVSLGGWALPQPGSAQITPWDCCFSDGSMLVRKAPTRRPMRELPASQDETWYHLKSGGALDTTAALLFEGSDPPIMVGPFSAPNVKGGLSVPMPLPFSRTAQILPAGENIVHARGDRFEFALFSREGRLQRIVRADLPPVTPTAAQIDSAKKEFASVQYGNSPDYKQVAAATVANAKLPATLPALSRILAERDGVVWVSNYRAPGSKEHWWARFDSEGHLSGTLELSPEWRVIRFTGDKAIVAKPPDNDGFSRISLLAIKPVKQ